MNNNELNMDLNKGLNDVVENFDILDDAFAKMKKNGTYKEYCRIKKLLLYSVSYNASADVIKMYSEMLEIQKKKLIDDFKNYMSL